MNDDARLTRVRTAVVDDDDYVEDKFFVCNDWHIFCDGSGGTEVFDMSGKWVKTLGEEHMSMVTVGKDILAAATSRSTIGVWSTRGEMEQLHDLQLKDFGVFRHMLAKVVVVDKMTGTSNKVIILTLSDVNDIAIASMIVTEMGEDGRWKDKILANFPVMDREIDIDGHDCLPPVVAGRGDWIARAFIEDEMINDDVVYIRVAFWREDKRLPDVDLFYVSPDNCLNNRLTGISIEHTIEGLKLVISLENEYDTGSVVWAMLVYNMVPNKTADEGINLDLIKTVRSGPHLLGTRKWEEQVGKLISTDLILGYFAPGHPNAVVTLYEKKKMLDTNIAIKEVRARQISFLCSCHDEFELGCSQFGFNLTHIVCRKEEVDYSDADDDDDDGFYFVRNIFVKDFGLSTAQSDEVDQLQ